MTLSADIARLLGENDLDEAIEAAKAHLKTNPSDQTSRHLYIDLLVLAGDYERADSQCGLAVTFAPEATMGFALLRNELRGMASRLAWFESGAVPEFPQGPSELDRLAISLGIAHRTGQSDEARAEIAAIEEARGERPFLWNGKRVSDLRDLDDRTPHALEVIMSGGAYLWVDFSKIAAVSLEPVSRPRDLAFRRAELSLTDGAVAPVLLPVIYHGTSGNPKLRLGRETEWVDEPTGIVTGRGQRCFLAGDELVALHDAETLSATDVPSTSRQVAHG